MVARPRRVLTAAEWAARLAAVKPLAIACDGDELLVAALLAGGGPLVVHGSRNPKAERGH
jgi:hypothetical protein